MNRLRNKLILIFLAATLAPLAATVWITNSLLERSLDYASTAQLDSLSKSLQVTGHELYQHICQDVKKAAEAGSLQPQTFTDEARANWPESVTSFVAGSEREACIPGGKDGNRLDYLVRHAGHVSVYSTGLGEVAMDRLAEQIREAGRQVDHAERLDLRRGFKLVYVLAAASIWILSLALLVYFAHRISRPIQELTAGLTKLSAGDLNARVKTERDDEVGRAVQAFNHMAERLQESTERLVYLRQLAGWQSLARKTAHEVKNSLTPIRLTVEEMLARAGGSDRAFIEQAAQIVVDEIETLERRVRAFSQFAAEPPVRPGPVDVNAVVAERIAFLKNAHPEVAYDYRAAEGGPRAMADQDLLKGILTNLLENAAEAAGEGGRILSRTAAVNGHVEVEVHDSGPGLSEQARASLFEPTISFKKRGMGLGLSIARKSALLSGGDILAIEGELGGAGFRVLLPATGNGNETHPDRG